MKTRIPQIVAMLLAVAAIVAFFLPYVSSTEEYKRYLDANASEKIYNTNLTRGDMKDLSLFEYTMVYYQGRQEIFHDDYYGILYAILIGSIGVFALFAFLCAWRKRPILLLLFSALMGGTFHLTNWDFMDRGIMPSSNRVWGITHTILLPIAIALAACSIWLFVAKCIDKKQKRGAEYQP